MSFYNLPGVIFDMVVFRKLQLDPVEKNLKVVGRWQSCKRNGVEYRRTRQEKTRRFPKGDDSRWISFHFGGV
jgi:hypothetical protein